MSKLSAVKQSKISLCKMTIIVLMCLGTSGCVGALVGAVVDTTIEVAKVPFKVAGAVIDVATGDEDEPKRKKKRKKDEE